MPVIGVLGPATAEVIPHLLAAFRRGLAEAGYVDGKNLIIEYRFPNYKLELLPGLARDLIQRNVKVIFALTPETVAAARNETTSIPIVALDLESDPIAMGYVESLARPGGNLTGVFLDIPEMSGKQVGLLKEMVPRLSRLAIFGIPGLNSLQFASTKAATEAFALEPETIEVRVPSDFEDAFETARSRHVEAGILLSSPLMFNKLKANQRACAGQTTASDFLVRRISEGQRLDVLRTERSRDISKRWGVYCQDITWCQAG